MNCTLLYSVLHLALRFRGEAPIMCKIRKMRLGEDDEAYGEKEGHDTVLQPAAA